MPTIHAVIYSHKRFAWISVAEWVAEGTGIVKLSGLEDPALRPLSDYVATNLDEDVHKITPNADGLVFERQIPRLLLFRLDGEDWVARGFLPWGSVDPDDETPVRLRLVASDADSAQHEGYRWARAAARLLYHMRIEGAASASQQVLDLLGDDARSLQGSIAFPTPDAVTRRLDPGAAADFGNAADADD